jgi:hypothetical protein
MTIGDKTKIIHENQTTNSDWLPASSRKRRKINLEVQTGSYLGDTNTDASDFNGSQVLANFKFGSDGNGGTIVYDPPVSDGCATQSIGHPAEAGKALNFTSVSGFRAEENFGPRGADFNAPTLGFLKNSTNTGATPSCADASQCALFGHYMASNLLAAGYGLGERRRLAMR